MRSTRRCCSRTRCGGCGGIGRGWWRRGRSDRCADILRVKGRVVMTLAQTETAFSPEDLLRMEDGINYELVDGKLVERHMGMESSEIAARIVLLIGIFLR